MVVDPECIDISGRLIENIFISAIKTVCSGFDSLSEFKYHVIMSMFLLFFCEIWSFIRSRKTTKNSELTLDAIYRPLWKCPCNVPYYKSATVDNPSYFRLLGYIFIANFRFTIVLSVFDSDYPFGIFKLFFKELILITPICHLM